MNPYICPFIAEIKTKPEFLGSILHYQVGGGGGLYYQDLIRAFSDFKAFLYILIGGRRQSKYIKKALKSEKARINQDLV